MLGLLNPSYPEFGAGKPPVCARKAPHADTHAGHTDSHQVRFSAWYGPTTYCSWNSADLFHWPMQGAALARRSARLVRDPQLHPHSPQRWPPLSSRSVFPRYVTALCARIPTDHDTGHVQVQGCCAAHNALGIRPHALFPKTSPFFSPTMSTIARSLRSAISRSGSYVVCPLIRTPDVSYSLFARACLVPSLRGP
jgi:hypothetical protein